METCPDCGEDVAYLGTEQRTYRPDMNSMTEGQFADQVGAEMGGDFQEGIHGETVKKYLCESCEKMHIRGVHD